MHIRTAKVTDQKAGHRMKDRPTVLQTPSAVYGMVAPHDFIEGLFIVREKKTSAS